MWENAVAGLMVVALGWFAVRRSSDPLRMTVRLVVTGILLAATVALLRGRMGFGPGARTDPIMVVALAAVCGIGLTIVWGKTLGEALANSVTHLFDGGGRELERRPLYSMAEAQMKRGRVAEAEAALRQQLAEFPDDLQGHLLLAELQAGAMADVASAVSTLEEYAARQGISAGDEVVVLHRIADLKVRHGGDLEGAGQALRRILELAPDTDAAFLAQQRLAHLPTPEVLQEFRAPHRIEVPKGDERLGLRPRGSVLPPPEEDPGVTLARHLKQLERDPDDCEARESLAWVYASRLGRLDLAESEYERLLGRRNAPAGQVVRWLNALADAQVQFGGNLEAAAAALRRIEERYPKSAQAEVAMRRRMHLPLEMRRKVGPRRVGAGGPWAGG